MAAVSLPDPITRGMLQLLRIGNHPRLVLAASFYPPPPGYPALLKNLPLLSDKLTAHVWKHLVYKQPVNAPEEMLAQLAEPADDG